MSKRNRRLVVWAIVLFVAFRVLRQRRVIQLAGGLLLLVLAAWIFARTWWGGLPHVLAGAVR